ncbi:MAG TPA: cupin domain-containing protein [Chloroflexota bacterium]|jgi:quercetin dioxygenase-like cupin family protein
MRPVIDNPRSGERIVISQSGTDTDGQLLAFDLFLQPGAHVPARHSHPRQEERFTVLTGAVRFRVGTQTLLAHPGMTLTVPHGTTHWFGNGGSEVARMRVEVRPALRMQELLEASVATTQRRWWSRLMALALIPLDFQLELGVPYVPSRLLKPLVWLRRRPLLGA